MLIRLLSSGQICSDVYVSLSSKFPQAGCLNDSSHTSHHQNPFLHRCDHSAAFLKAKHLHTPQRAIVLCNIDYLTITYRLMWKDYDYLAELGADWGADWDEPRGEGRDVDNLKSKTGRFSEEDIGNSGRNEWQRYGRYVLRVSSTAKFYWRLRSHSYLFRITPSYFDFLLLVLFAHCNTRPITKQPPRVFQINLELGSKICSIKGPKWPFEIPGIADFPLGDWKIGNFPLFSKFRRPIWATLVNRFIQVADSLSKCFEPITFESETMIL